MGPEVGRACLPSWGGMAQRMQTIARMAAVLVSCLALGGCAPSFNLFGAFFPAWMLCGAIGIASAIVARLIFVAKALNGALPFQLLVCSAIGMIVGVFSWLVLFGF